jgi:hypothetical protein
MTALLLSAPVLVLAALGLLGAYAVLTAPLREDFPQHGN